MTKTDSLLGCAALAVSVFLALYAGEARAADLPMTAVSLPSPPIVSDPGCTLWVPSIFGGLVCGAVQYGGGSANVVGPTGGTRTVTVTHTPPTPTPTPPSPPGDDCGPKGEGGDVAKSGGRHGGEGRHHGHEGKPS